MLSRAFPLLVLILASPAIAIEPPIRFVPATKSHPAAVEALHLEAAVVAKLKQSPPADWTPLFSVQVASDETPMLGTYRLDPASLRFEPRFPFVEGLKYRATFDPSKLPGAAEAQPFQFEFTIPKSAPKPPAVVEQIYPTRNDLPENQLKFYLHFSRPMGRGEAFQHVRLIDADGKTIKNPFLDVEELWTPDGKRFTLFLHPGRIKLGLQPRDEFGPPLVAGKRYTLVVDAAWPDENGQALKAEFRKSFSVGKPDEVQPDPKTWKIEAPSAASSNPVHIQFPESLDRALLQRMLEVVDSAGKKVAGAIRVSHEETVWEFTPEKPWAAGAYRVTVDTALEDLAGNSIASPFEITEKQPATKGVGKTMELPFTVR